MRYGKKLTTYGITANAHKLYIGAKILALYYGLDPNYDGTTEL